MKTTGRELNLITEAMDGTQDKYTIEDLFAGWDDDDEITEIKKRLTDWSVQASDDGSTVDHDFQMYDNFITFFSPNNIKTKIVNRHCLATGFNFNETEIFVLNK